MTKSNVGFDENWGDQNRIARIESNAAQLDLATLKDFNPRFSLAPAFLRMPATKEGYS